MMKNRSPWLWLIPFVLVVVTVLLLSMEESRTFVVALFLRALVFLKKNIIMLLSTFFLVKGKFILTLFMKKIALLSATGLGKRYLIEKVINHNFKIHFLNHISDDIKHLMDYVKKNFQDFPILKQFIAGFTFLASLGFVGKFMGGMLAMKVFIAKIWSFLLAIFLKVGTTILYFFTDYLWGGWIAPIVEVFIFSWLLEWMEKIPLLKRGLNYIYTLFHATFETIEFYLEKVFHIPVRSFFKFLTVQSKKIIYKFIGYERVSSWYRLIEIHKLDLNKRELLVKKRENRKILSKKSYLSPREKLKEKREKRVR